MIRQVSSLLLNPTEKLKIQLVVSLLDANGQPNYCGIFRGEGPNEYLTISPKPYMAFRYINKEKPWTRQNGLMITQRNIYKLRFQMGHFYKTLLANEKNIYQYDTNSGYIISMGDVTPYEETIYLGMGQVLRLSPTTLYDERNRPFPGVFLYINQLSNEVELSMEEYESVHDLVQTIQLHQEGLLLLQTYVTLCVKNGEVVFPIENSYEGTKKSTSKPPPVKMNVFESFEKTKQQEVKEPKEFVQGPMQIKPVTSLEDL